ncbi:MAG: hypothetical protein ACREDR_46850, partial [Blastocatellia bacterium]
NTQPPPPPDTVNPFPPIVIGPLDGPDQPPDPQIPRNNCDRANVDKDLAYFGSLLDSNDQNLKTDFSLLSSIRDDLRNSDPDLSSAIGEDAGHFGLLVNAITNGTGTGGKNPSTVGSNINSDIGALGTNFLPGDKLGTDVKGFWNVTNAVDKNADAANNFFQNTDIGVCDNLSPKEDKQWEDLKKRWSREQKLMIPLFNQIHVPHDIGT